VLALTAPSGTTYDGVLVMNTLDKTFVLSNTGQQTTSAVTVVLTTAATSGLSLLPFATGDCVSGTTTLAGGLSCNIRVRFTAPGPGIQTATLGASATTGGTATPPLSLSATGARPALLASTSTMSNPNFFGAFPVGATSGPMTWTIRNDGDQTTGVPVLTNSNVAEVLTTQNTCTAGLTGGATCTIMVAFRPAGLAARTGTLTLTASPGGSVIFTATATGQTAAALTLTEMPDSHDFGLLPIGALKDESFTVTNSGGQTTSVITVTLSTNPDFTLLSPLPTVGCVSGTTTLVTNATCVIRVHFLPTADGPRTASLGASATTGGSGSLTLTGRRQNAAALALMGSPLDFGAVPIGGMQTGTFTVTNNGEQPTTVITLALTPSTTDFKLLPPGTCVNGATTLTAGMSCTINVTFQPTTDATQMTSLGVSAATGGLSNVLALTGRRQTAPALVLTDQLTDLSMVPVGQTVSAGFLLQNTGESATDIMIAPIVADSFTLGAGTTCGTMLAGGSSCQISVDFTPLAASTYSTTLTVTSNGAVAPLPIMVMGTGIATTPPPSP
jgi:hypothetical protein